MKSKYIIYPATILLMLGVPILRYYASTPDNSACVLEYVDEFKNSNYQGYMYNINGVKHIEPTNSNLVKHLEPYKVGEARGCLMISDNILSDLNNSFYCSVSYLIKNAPIAEKYKQPLGIIKDPIN